MGNGRAASEKERTGCRHHRRQDRRHRQTTNQGRKAGFDHFQKNLIRIGEVQELDLSHRHDGKNCGEDQDRIHHHGDVEG